MIICFKGCIVLRQQNILNQNRRMPFTKVYIHFVWSTKHRQRFLNTRKLRIMVWNHIRTNARSKGIFVDTVSGYDDHCHCLVGLGLGQCMSETMQFIKGESSHWINSNELCARRFEWQNHYYAVSVSPSDLKQVRAYIRNQERHHGTITIEQEWEELDLAEYLICPEEISLWE